MYTQIRGGGSLDSIVGVKELTLGLFLFYMNISEMLPGSLILASWVILCIGWSIPMVSTLGYWNLFSYKEYGN